MNVDNDVAPPTLATRLSMISRSRCACKEKPLVLRHGIRTKEDVATGS